MYGKFTYLSISMYTLAFVYQLKINLKTNFEKEQNWRTNASDLKPPYKFVSKKRQCGIGKNRQINQ